MSTDSKEAKKTETPSFKEPKWTFKNALEYLLNTATAIKDAQMKNMDINSPSPLWSMCIDKMISLFIGLKEGSTECLTNMFVKFYAKYRENLTEPIFNEDDDSPNDDWLNINEVLPGPGVKVSKKTKKTKKVRNDFLRWSSKVYCTGIVIYSDEDDPSNYQVSIPISEMYITACNIFTKERNEKRTISPLPGKVLYGLYSCAHRSLIEGNLSREAKQSVAADLTKIEANIKELKAFIEQNSPKQDAPTATGNMIDNLIDKFSKYSGISVDRNKISSLISNVTQNKDVAQIGNTVKKLVDTVDTTVKKSEGTDDKSKVQSIISAVAGSLQTKEVSEMITDTAITTQKLISSIPSNDNIAATLSSSGIDPNGLKPLLNQLGTAIGVSTSSSSAASATSSAIPSIVTSSSSVATSASARTLIPSEQE